MRLRRAAARASIVTLLMVSAAMPVACQTSRLTGVWAITFTLDSASPLLPRPAARTVSGTVAFGTIGTDSVYGWRAVGGHPVFGRSALNFTPLFGGRIANDVSTSIQGPVDTAFATEAVGKLGIGDTVKVELIPRISHGGVSFKGKLRRDTVIGTWEQRAYCCGARGHFTMHRVDANPPMLTLPPEPPPPVPLDTTRLGQLRVRVLDRVSGTYVPLYYGIRFPSGVWQYGNYHAGAGPDGWGAGKWLAPGTYEIVFEKFPCGSDEWFLRTPIRETVEVYEGRKAELTTVITPGQLEARVAYNSPRGGYCQPK